MSVSVHALDYAARLAGSSLERTLVSPHGFGLVTATPLQQAICRIADGEPLSGLETVPLLAQADAYAEDIQERATLAWSIGDVRKLPASRPAELYIVGPIRSGKSLMTAAVSVCATQRCDMSLLGPGEVPRVSVVSLTTDLARVVHQHVVGRSLASRHLRNLMAGDPTTDSVMFRHPSGVPVEVKIVAGARAGGSLVARWSAGVVFDEFTRMTGHEDGVVNFDDARTAVSGRLLPGAQLCGIGSPWAPFGPAYAMVNQYWQDPSRERVIIRAVGPAMNPVYWTPQRCEELRRRDPVAFRTDVLGEFADPEMSLFTASDLDAVTRPNPIDVPPVHGQFYVAAMDPATRADAWTLVIATRLRSGIIQIVRAQQWQASKGAPLSPEAVLRDMSETLRPYNVSRVTTDQWAADALADLGARYNLWLHSENITATKKVELFESMRAMVLAKRVELPPVRELQDDIRRVRKRVTQSGITIELPRAGGRHCDYAFATALALAQPVGEPVPEASALPTGWEQWELDEADRLAKRLRRDDGDDTESELDEWDD